MRFTTLVLLGLLVMVFMAVPGKSFGDKAEQVKHVSKKHLGVLPFSHSFIGGLEVIHNGADVLITKLTTLHSQPTA